MQLFGLVALVVVATLWTGAFVMWVLGLPRDETRIDRRLAPETTHTDL